MIRANEGSFFDILKDDYKISLQVNEITNYVRLSVVLRY